VWFRVQFGIDMHGLVFQRPQNSTSLNGEVVKVEYFMKAFQF
jgi:hypothetical protein